MTKKLNSKGQCFVLVSLIVTAGLFINDLPAASDPDLIEFEPGELFVKFKSATNPALDFTNTKLGSSVKETFIGDPKLFLLQLPENMSVGEAIDQLANDETIEYAEPNYIYYPVDTTPNDPRFSQQWGPIRVNARRAWDFTTGDWGIMLADHDTGMDLSHPDLVDNYCAGWDFLSGGPNPQDLNGHGSHTAGTMAATGNNGVGVAGMMWNGCLMILRICGGGCSIPAAINAIDYGIQNGAWASNNSWGGRGRSQPLKDAIDRADASGLLFVAAAGNANTNNDTRPFYPCNFGAEGSANVICVASTTSTDARSSFSCYGPNTVHLGAPGSSILSTYRGGGYATMSGTSMASPHVVGTAGLIWSKNPNLGHYQVKDIILNNVRPASSMQGRTITGGILDAGRALENTP